MNEFIELEVLTESGIIYKAGDFIEKLINADYRSYTPNELRNQLEYLNSKFKGTTTIEIYNCSQIKKVYNYIQSQYGFEHTIYQIRFVDNTDSYISQEQYKKLREVLLNTKK